jgi:hypothetical protein
MTPKYWTGIAIFATMIDSLHTNIHMKKIHSFLVTAYMLGGLALMATTPFADLRGQVQTYNGGATLSVRATHAEETLRGAAEDPAMLADETNAAYKSAAASRQLMLGVLLFTLGGMVHAYEVVRSERRVKITVKKRKPMTLFWLQMKI